MKNKRNHIMETIGCRNDGSLWQSLSNIMSKKYYFFYMMEEEYIDSVNKHILNNFFLELGI